MGCEINSYSYDSSPILGSADSILWTGGDIVCNGEVLVCNGARLTTLEKAFADKICSLIQATDLSTLSISVPPCLLSAWQLRNNDYTILNSVIILMDALCDLKTQVESEDNNTINKDTPIDITWGCCVSECNDGTALNVSDSFQAVVDCLCAQAQRITTLELALSGYATQSQITSLENQINCIKGALFLFNSNNPSLTPINLTGC